MSNKFQTNFKLFLCQSKVDRHTQSHFEVDHTDGVLSFPELEVVMKNLGQVPTETELLRMVREVRKVSCVGERLSIKFSFSKVSEDKVYDTIEFNEFLQVHCTGTSRSISSLCHRLILHCWCDTIKWCP